MSKLVVRMSKPQAKDLPDKPVEVIHGYLVIYPDLMDLFEYYTVDWDNQKLKVWKTKVNVEVLDSQHTPLLILPLSMKLNETLQFGDYIAGKSDLGVISISKAN